MVGVPKPSIVARGATRCVESRTGKWASLMKPFFYVVRDVDNQRLSHGTTLKVEER